jgi:alanine racemase
MKGYLLDMSNSKTFSTWAEINLDAIVKNVQLIRDHTGVQVMAVVKANAYGHGLIPVAKAALRGGASWLGVARIEEAVELREAGLNCPILVMGHIPGEKMVTAINQDISVTIWSLEQLKTISAAAQMSKTQAKVHLKIDTGMSRLGIQPNEVQSLAEMVNIDPWVIFEGLFTHFARADEDDQTPTEHQEWIFTTTLTSLTATGIRPPFVHAANSAATLSRPSSHFNMVRPGIVIYGLHPSMVRQLPVEFRPALAWKTTLSQVKTLPPGRGISYGHEYVTQNDERIGTVPVGYADGYRRVAGNQVLIEGKLVPVVGRVCMDQISVQLDGVPTAKQGDEVVIIGTQGENSIAAEQVAELWGTINYEVVCGISARVRRVFV